MLGQAREKFASIAGPQGGTALNGAALKAEGQAEIDKTDRRITNASHPAVSGYTWIIG
jgi:hypothetical protein